MTEPLSQRLRKHLDPDIDSHSLVPQALLGEAVGALSVHERQPTPAAVATLEQRLNRLVDLIEKGDRVGARQCVARALSVHFDMPEFVRRRLDRLADGLALRERMTPSHCITLAIEARDFLRDPSKATTPYPLHKRFDMVARAADRCASDLVIKYLRFAEKYHPDMPHGARDAINRIRAELSDSPVDWDAIVRIARQASRELERAAEPYQGCGSAAAQAGTIAHLIAEAMLRSPSETAENKRLTEQLDNAVRVGAERESTISSLQCRGSHLERQLADLQAKLSTATTVALERFDALPRYESSAFSGMNTKPEGNYVYRDDARQVLLDMKAHLGTGGERAVPVSRMRAVFDELIKGFDKKDAYLSCTHVISMLVQARDRSFPTLKND